MKLLVTMGYHTKDRSDQWKYDTAALVMIDWNRKRVVRELTYVSPPEQSAKQGHMLFAHGHLMGNELLVTTATEILTIDVPSWRITRVITRPYFNDLHHVAVIGEQLYVVNTGLQAVHKLTMDGDLVGTYSTNGIATWEAYDQSVDYRPLNTKPHSIHPNYVFAADGAVFVTRCKKADAVQIDAHSNRFPIEIGHPHDGIVCGNLAYFTTTNGHVVGVDCLSRRHALHVNLNELDSRNQQLGWCRGILPLDDRFAIVGFSQFRRSTYKELAHWILNDGRGCLPSRLALYDLKNRRRVDEMVFTGSCEGTSIYSIFAWDK